MKKIDTLKKELENISNEELKNIINNENVDIDSLSDFEKLSVLMYRELSKAINNKKYNLLLDCNYANSKNEILLVDYYRLAVANSMIQVYVRKNSFRICTSASKSNREKFSQLENELHFITKYDKKTNRAKTTERINISYEDIVSVIKQVIAILEDTTKQENENESNEE
jgi:hypothetical protein